MATTKAAPRPTEASERGPGYDDDVFPWTRHQAEPSRSGHIDRVD